MTRHSDLWSARPKNVSYRPGDDPDHVVVRLVVSEPTEAQADRAVRTPRHAVGRALEVRLSPEAMRQWIADMTAASNMADARKRGE